MDLGCIDMGCVEKPKKEGSAEKENSPCPMSASKLGKNNRAKDAIRSSLTALNRLTSQISKPPHRKTSPLHWFPRKKVEPYLKRKIKLLQEVDGINSTLDETLGDSHPHYSRVLREKIAIREVAEKAMVAQKAAMVEASWCRILQAARIESKYAEAHLSKVEADAADAFEAARVAGVIMNDIPVGVGNHYQTETISAKGVSMTHTVSAIFETAFEVDKQVAAAVKAAFVKLASSPLISEDELKELLRKISENPDMDENRDLSEITSECESDADPQPEVEKDNLNSDGAIMRKPKRKQELDKCNMDNIVDMMLGRLQCLKEDELASLAMIVATSGLSAALSETGTSKSSVLAASENTENSCPKITNSRISLGGRTARRNTIITRQTKRSDTELPSLDKFLVKRLTRLEREVFEAKNSRKKELGNGNETERVQDNTPDVRFSSIENRSSRVEIELKEDLVVSDLGSEIVKHSAKLEKEDVQRSRKSSRTEAECEVASSKHAELPSLDKFLVKHLTRLEREVLEVLEAKSRNNMEYPEGGRVLNSVKTATLAAKAKDSEEIPFCNIDSECKENLDLNRVKEKNIGRNPSREEIVLGDQKKEKEASSGRRGWVDQGESCESLDKVLVKHVSRLEKEKQEFHADDRMQMKQRRMDTCTKRQISEGSLDEVLVKHKSRLEREKMAATTEQDNSIRHSVSRREAREKELQAAWGGMSLGNSMRPHVSRLQRDKAAWIEAEADEMKRTLEE